MHIVEILKRTTIDESSKFDNYDNWSENWKRADYDNYDHEDDDYLHLHGHFDGNDDDDVEDDEIMITWGR